jgi:hypothetical protein
LSAVSATAAGARYIVPLQLKRRHSTFLESQSRKPDFVIL